MLQHDRPLTISTANSRKATQWPATALRLHELYQRLAVPQRGAETLEQYLALPKGQQDELKDVGGFLGGGLTGNRRKASNVAFRDVLTLDLDNLPPGSAEDALRRLDSLPCAWAVYSTRKHRPEAPRLRILFTPDRSVSSDEYEPLLRKMAELAGVLDWCDPTTFSVNRLMYWPSTCVDGEYIFKYGDRPFLAADGVLGMYADWHDVSQWPQVPGAAAATNKLVSKQEDPATKKGVVGAFCRVYDVPAAMDAFLPGVYLPTDQPDRYTYSEGSTTGGAVLYDNGQFLYSHHATDPCCEKLVNAFDLVRWHKFGELDEDDKNNTESNKAMLAFAVADHAVAALLDQERYDNAVEVFAGVAAEPAAVEDTAWMASLVRHPQTGKPEKMINNVKRIIQNDPRLKGRIRLDLFADAYVGQGPLPWELRKDTTDFFQWSDRDDGGLRNYIETMYGLKGKDLIFDGLSEAAASLAYDPVTDYLAGLAWDGIPRLDTLYIDFLGADDSPYTRAVTRKAFVAAVARAFKPGTKFDYMSVVCGRQGIGKSTLFSRMGCGWFSDSIKTFEGKEAAELLQGVWICEIGELEAFSRTDVRIIRSFLSKLDDQYRAAYARRTERHPRRCVFFGTTNDHEYLKDTTGNRRFWPVDAEHQPPKRVVFTDLTEAVVGQLWAEAVVFWRRGESLILPPELEAEAERRREEHFDIDPLQGQIEEFLSKPIPEDWADWPLSRRRMFWNGGEHGDRVLVPRERVCVMEILRECLGDTRATIPRADSNRVANALAKMPRWEKVSTMRFGAEYGTQKGYRRVNRPW